MIDISHPSKHANLQAMERSRAPVIASHSSARARADHIRNLDDEQLFALQANGGVVPIVAFRSFLRTSPAPSREQQQETTTPLEQLDSPVSVRDLVDHIDYVVDLIGIEHVGISSDFDDLERQPATRNGRGGAGGTADPGVRHAAGVILDAPPSGRAIRSYRDYRGRWVARISSRTCRVAPARFVRPLP